VLLSLVTGGAALLAGTRLWSWSSPELAAVFIALSVLLSVVGGLKAAVAADAFVEGMRSMLLAGLLIGLAGAVEIILQGSQVMDSIIQAVTGVVQGHAPGLVATGLMGSEMVLDVFIPSVSGKGRDQHAHPDPDRPPLRGQRAGDGDRLPCSAAA
jgi:uncharacterized ion transporter superfamily protein YfcC